MSDRAANRVAQRIAELSDDEKIARQLMQGVRKVGENRKKKVLSNLEQHVQRAKGNLEHEATRARYGHTPDPKRLERLKAQLEKERQARDRLKKGIVGDYKELEAELKAKIVRKLGKDIGDGVVDATRPVIDEVLGRVDKIGKGVNRGAVAGSGAGGAALGYAAGRAVGKRATRKAVDLERSSSRKKIAAALGVGGAGGYVAHDKKDRLEARINELRDGEKGGRGSGNWGHGGLHGTHGGSGEDDVSAATILRRREEAGVGKPKEELAGQPVRMSTETRRELSGPRERARDVEANSILADIRENARAKAERSSSTIKQKTHYQLVQEVMKLQRMEGYQKKTAAEKAAIKAGRSYVKGFADKLGVPVSELNEVAAEMRHWEDSSMGPSLQEIRREQQRGGEVARAAQSRSKARKTKFREITRKIGWAIPDAIATEVRSSAQAATRFGLQSGGAAIGQRIAEARGLGDNEALRSVRERSGASFFERAAVGGGAVVSPDLRRAVLREDTMRAGKRRGSTLIDRLKAAGIDPNKDYIPTEPFRELVDDDHVTAFQYMPEEVQKAAARRMAGIKNPNDETSKRAIKRAYSDWMTGKLHEIETDPFSGERRERGRPPVDVNGNDIDSDDSAVKWNAFLKREKEKEKQQRTEARFTEKVDSHRQTAASRLFAAMETRGSAKPADAFDGIPKNYSISDIDLSKRETWDGFSDKDVADMAKGMDALTILNAVEGNIPTRVKESLLNGAQPQKRKIIATTQALREKKRASGSERDAQALKPTKVKVSKPKPTPQEVAAEEEELRQTAVYPIEGITHDRPKTRRGLSEDQFRALSPRSKDDLAAILKRSNSKADDIEHLPPEERAKAAARQFVHTMRLVQSAMPDGIHEDDLIAEQRKAAGKLYRNNRKGIVEYMPEVLREMAGTEGEEKPKRASRPVAPAKPTGDDLVRQQEEAAYLHRRRKNESTAFQHDDEVERRRRFTPEEYADMEADGIPLTKYGQEMAELGRAMRDGLARSASKQLLAEYHTLKYAEKSGKTSDEIRSDIRKRRAAVGAGAAGGAATALGAAAAVARAKRGLFVPKALQGTVDDIVKRGVRRAAQKKPKEIATIAGSIAGSGAVGGAGLGGEVHDAAERRRDYRRAKNSEAGTKAKAEYHRLKYMEIKEGA